MLITLGFLVGLVMFGIAIGCMKTAATGFAIIGAGLVIVSAFCGLFKYLNP